MTAITPDAAAKHIGALLGIAVSAKKAAPADLKGPRVVAQIRDEEKNLVCIILFDLGAAGSTGAALSRIPQGAVQDSIKRGVLEEGLFDNAHEIANVLTVLTTQALGRRSILQSIKQSKDAAADKDAQTFISAAKNTIFMQLTVPGYPGGVCGFLLP